MIRPNRAAPTRLLLLAALAALLAGCQLFAAAGAAARTIDFHGHRVQAPSSWPVYRLSQHPGMCVRLDRRAVYLGAPAANQRCPAEAAVGRRRAIVVDPGAAARQAASTSRLPVPARRIAGASASSVFTGLGFDACSAPSTKAMTAWGTSPYRAIGVYIGGENRGCSQPNLTSAWVSAEVAGGWHLIPTYVGLQAPTSSCSSCAKLTSSAATAQGTAAAVDAVAQASAVAMGPGSPIYFDMESYSRTTSATAATLAFLEAWTNKLHALGYVSGVYSSSASGIADLAGAFGSGYVEPDDLWIANWNNQQNTVDSVVPSTSWGLHQRIHQYQGGHNETYGGTTINIDNDYADGATVGTATQPTSLSNPIGSLEVTSSPLPGQVRVRGWTFDPDVPTQGLAIRVDVGGKDGGPDVAGYELGPIATLPRTDVATKYPQAGPAHGFNATFPVLQSGPQLVCAYAVNTGLGADRLLGCKRIGIPFALTFSNLRATAAGVRVRITCGWPVGTECPGQFSLRTRYRVTIHRRRRAPLVRVLTRSLGRRGFHLSGGQGHTFVIPYTAGGRALLRERGHLKAQLLTAIPGSKKTVVLGLGE